LGDDGVPSIPEWVSVLTFSWINGICGGDAGAKGVRVRYQGPGLLFPFAATRGGFGFYHGPTAQVKLGGGKQARLVDGDLVLGGVGGNIVQPCLGIGGPVGKPRSQGWVNGLLGGPEGGDNGARRHPKKAWARALGQILRGWDGNLSVVIVEGNSYCPRGFLEAYMG